jgi:hypothetical protein
MSFSIAQQQQEMKIDQKQSSEIIQAVLRNGIVIYKTF